MTPKPNARGYPYVVSALYAWVRRHPRLVDGVLAVALGFSGLGMAIATNRFWLAPATLALTVPVIFRRTHPVGAFAIVIAVGALQVIFDIRPAASDLAIVVLLYTLAAYTTRRTSLIGLGICLVGSAVEMARLSPQISDARHLGQVPPSDWLYAGAALLAGPLLIAWVLGDSMRYRRAYYAGLEERAAQLERDRDAQARIAAAAERARIARELHDVVAHNVSVMVVQADGAAYALGSDPARVREALAAISATGRQALAEMRALLGVLRKGDEVEADGPALAAVPADPGSHARAVTSAGPAGAIGPVEPYERAVVVGSGLAGSGLAGPGPAGPVPAGPVPAGSPGHAETASTVSLAPMPDLDQLDDLLEQTRAAGLAVSCTIEGEPRRLPSGAALAAYRIIQESLTNTRKHAGPFARAGVVLRYLPEAVELVIYDDGLGGMAPTDGAGHGLTGMRERAAMYGGSIRAEPDPRGGFIVEARLPLAAAQAGVA
jgi:signal transduction histidine kinase